MDLGSKVMTVLFGGNNIHSLTYLNYNSVIKKIVSGKSFVTSVGLLSPIKSSTKYHSFRVHY